MDNKFAVGKKVVCVYEGKWDGEEVEIALGVRFPKKGDSLTIRDMESDKDGVFLRFEEIVNPILSYIDGDAEIQFNAKHFVPLEETFQRVTFEKVIEMVEVGVN